jgi:hypothetical protein
LSGETEDEVADGRWLGEKRVVPGIQLDDLAGAAGELALAIGRRAAVVGTDHLKVSVNSCRLQWPDFRRSATTDWLAPLEQGLASLHRPELATRVLATLRGLLMDLDATGDTARTARAWRHLLDAIDSRPPEPAPTPGPKTPA